MHIISLLWPPLIKFVKWNQIKNIGCIQFANKPDTPDHARREDPVVFLPALALHAVNARVDNLYGLFFSAQIDVDKTRHEDFLRLQNEDLSRLKHSKQDFSSLTQFYRESDGFPCILVDSFDEILHPEVENVLLGWHFCFLIFLSKPVYESYVPYGWLQVPASIKNYSLIRRFDFNALPIGRLQFEHALCCLDGLGVVLGQDTDFKKGGYVPVLLQGRQTALFTDQIIQNHTCRKNMLSI